MWGGAPLKGQPMYHPISVGTWNKIDCRVLILAFKLQSFEPINSDTVTKKIGKEEN